ncbi:MAG TPA: phosphoglycerate dehydrogenase [Rhodospirillaceae bacterium]|nr:phosphoglycerate dehydrogenase [Rhodospirillaceae bacterium]|tara:strand:+ start:425 stop:1375 length:951 start_codon:yes stop_codon:yes gene_type:complete
MTRVAIPSISFCQTESLRQAVLEKYPDTRFNEEARRMTDDELVVFLSDRDAAIMGLENLTADMLDQLPELKIISRMGVGLDNVDPEMLRDRGIRIGWTGGTNRRSVAELMIAFSVCALRHVGPLYAAMRNGERPRHQMGRHLSGRVVGLHGCGNVGKDVVRLLQAWDCEILAHDLLDFPEFYDEFGVTPVSFEDLVTRSEVVSLHIPLDNTTRGLYSAGVLDLMRDDAVLINTCRGGIIDEYALKQRLMEGRLAAACIDAFAVEPPTDDELLNAPNFLCTPHIGGSAEEARLAMGRAAIDGIEDNFLPEPGVFPFA